MSRPVFDKKQLNDCVYRYKLATKTYGDLGRTKGGRKIYVIDEQRCTIMWDRKKKRLYAEPLPDDADADADTGSDEEEEEEEAGE